MTDYQEIVKEYFQSPEWMAVEDCCIVDKNKFDEFEKKQYELFKQRKVKSIDLIKE